MKKALFFLFLVIFLTAAACLSISAGYVDAVNVSSQEIKKGTPVIDGFYDNIYDEGACVTLKDMAKFYGPYEGEPTTNAKFNFLWDDNYFYMFAAVEDKTVCSAGEKYIFEESPANPWTNDAIETWFVFDESYVCKVHNDAYGKIMFVSEEGQNVAGYSLTAATLFDVSKSVYKCIPDAAHSTYSIEVAFKPAVDFARYFGAGKQFNFAVQVNNVPDETHEQIAVYGGQSSDALASDAFTFSSAAVEGYSSESSETIGGGTDTPGDDTPVTEGPKVSMKTIPAMAGDTVEVDIGISGNPGIASMGMELAFDPCLTLIGAENGEAFEELTMTPPAQLKKTGEVTGSCRFAWLGSDDAAEDGTILHLTFRVAEGTETGKNAAITAVCTEDDVFNADREMIRVSSKNGGIFVIDYIPGDVDGNGTVNMLDVLSLCQYYVDGCKYDPYGYAVTIKEAAGDVDGNGKINMLDVLMLCQYYVDGCEYDPDGYAVKLQYGGFPEEEQENDPDDDHGTTEDPTVTPEENTVRVDVVNGLLSNGYSGGNVVSGTQITLRAVIPEGKQFECWKDETGTVISTTSEYTVTVNQRKVFYAIVRNPTVTVTVINTAIPEVQTSELYEIGKHAILKPSLPAGYCFDHWEDENGTILSREMALSFMIPDNNVTYFAVCHTESQLQFTSNGNGTCYVSGIGTCTDTKIYIPSVNSAGDRVIKIGDRAFSEQTQITEIIIPNTVEEIGLRAFYGCTGLTEITVPASVTKIGAQIFYKANNLKTLYYNSVYNPVDAESSFLNSSSVDTVIFGGSRVPGYVCRGNTGVKNVTLLSNVKSIDSYAFYNCTGLISLTLEQGLTSIGYYVFQGCTSLTSIVIPNGIKNIYNYAFAGCTNLVSVTFPDSVTTIASSAFQGCTSLTNITIPDRITSIESSVFSGCTSLTSITIPDSVRSIESSAFSGCTNLINIVIPDSVTSIGSSVFSGCTSLTSIVVPDSVTSIGSSAFAGCTGLISVMLPKSMTMINNYTFYGCTGLKNITIPDSVTSIGNSAFQGCTGLTSITIPDSVIKIMDYAIDGCTHLTYITIPDSVMNIGSYIFRNCSNLKNILYVGTEEQWNAISKSTNWNSGMSGGCTIRFLADETPTEETDSRTSDEELPSV